MVPVHAVTVAVPADRPTATPELLASLLICATFMPAEFVPVAIHVTEGRAFPLLSVATNCCVCCAATDIVAEDGVTAIETRFGGIRVVGWYNSALAVGLSVLVLGAGITLLTTPPAMRTVPLLSSVAVGPWRAVISVVWFLLTSVVLEKVLAAGSYSSVFGVGVPLPSIWPPAMKTIPLFSSVAVWK